jgi:hypothetical protein
MNPAELQNPHQKWEEYMWDSLQSILIDKPTIYLIPGWTQSIGARLEVEFAKRLGLEIIGDLDDKRTD